MDGVVVEKLWLQLLYKIPRSPTSHRVYVWRKLKKLGAILLHDSVWCLPSTPRTLEHFQWLVVEIEELAGEAMLWESRLVLGGKDEMIIKRFIEQVNVGYIEILEKLKEKDPDYIALSKQYQQVKMQDYFGSELGEEIQKILLSSRGG
jgi:hypothetical protein